MVEALQKLESNRNLKSETLHSGHINEGYSSYLLSYLSRKSDLTFPNQLKILNSVLWRMIETLIINMLYIRYVI